MESRKQLFFYYAFTKWIFRKIMNMFHSNYITKTIHKRCFQLPIRASTSVGGNSCIIEKTSIFTHFVSKLHYISASKVLYNHVYLSKSYSNCEYIHGYCNSCIQYFNNFWFAPFFSLSSPSTQLTIPQHVLSSSDTHSHRHKIKNQLQTSKINHKINNKINH